uniref:Uncharacterized protein n=1 Tax=Lactuca sativa TaxID=4236 RepID=A0A9R1VU37_LACSA|nr:hypothetical protein LSAT_V11C400203780 [Lactuca sativa]
MGLAIIHAPLISMSWGVKQVKNLDTKLIDDFVDVADISSNLHFFNISRFMYGSSVLAGIMNCSCESFVVHLLVKMFLSSKSQLKSFLECLSLIIYYCLLLLFYDKVMKVGCASMYSAFIFYFVVFRWLS